MRSGEKKVLTGLYIVLYVVYYSFISQTRSQGVTMDLNTVRHPEIAVELTGHDGNAFAIMGRVSAALRKAGVPSSEVDEYMQESMAGDYDALLRTAMAWVTVE